MAISRAKADEKVDMARENIRNWGLSISHGVWDWHLLGHALEAAYEAMEMNREYQRPWTMLADLYHRIGKTHLAKDCLGRSYAAATSGPRFPGRFYREVESHIKSGYPFDTIGRIRRESPPEWFEKRYERYWKL